MINPWDIKSVANTINEALSMSDFDKNIHHRQLFGMVSQFSRTHWKRSYFNELVKVCRFKNENIKTSYLNLGKFVQMFKNSGRRLFLLEYDGTLTNIRPTPDEAIPSIALKRLLEALTEQSEDFVFILSERDRAFLEK